MQVVDKTALVVGGSKGVGLALCVLLKQQGYHVYATCRTSTDALQAAQVQVITGVDLEDDSCQQPILQAIGNQKLHLLLVVAGLQHYDTLKTLDRKLVRQQLEVNAVGPLFLVQALQQNLADLAKVVLLASRMGSLTQVDFTAGDVYGYRMGKAALHIAGVTLARDFKKVGIPVGLIHPGVVNTEMYNTLQVAKNTPMEKRGVNTLTPEQSAERIYKLVQGLNLENTGSFWDADKGIPIPW